MKKPPVTALMLSALLSASVLASPLALAGQYHDGDHKGDLCERLKNHEGQWNGEEHAARMQQWAEQTADRLQLTESQRKTWDEIQQERQQKRQQRAEQWRAKMQKRCDNQ